MSKNLNVWLTPPGAEADHKMDTCELLYTSLKESKPEPPKHESPRVIMFGSTKDRVAKIAKKHLFDPNFKGELGTFSLGTHTSGPNTTNLVYIFGLGEEKKGHNEDGKEDGKKNQKELVEGLKRLTSLGVKLVLFHYNMNSKWTINGKDSSNYTEKTEKTEETEKAKKFGQLVAETLLLFNYSFDKYKSPKPSEALDVVIAVEDDLREPLKESMQKGFVYAKATTLACDMTNEPPNVMNPQKMADEAMRIAKESNGDIKLDLHDKKWCKDQNMGAFLGVAEGSAAEPKFIHLKYNGAKDSEKTLWLLGKSITFDSGGLSLKTPLGMVTMKTDMAGGAAVLGAIEAIAKLKLEINVNVVCAATENMPGGKAQRPGDVVRAKNGKSIEVNNTDAEGRLTLADAASFAVENKATAIVDVATLTGAINVALGAGQSGAFSNNDALYGMVKKACTEKGEPVWRLPLDEVSKKQNTSKVADVLNTGGAAAGSITAAHFIQEFVDGTPWVHIDIAGTRYLEKGSTTMSPGATGATGVMARSMVQLASDIADEGWGFLGNEKK